MRGRIDGAAGRQTYESRGLGAVEEVWKRLYLFR